MVGSAVLLSHCHPKHAREQDGKVPAALRLFLAAPVANQVHVVKAEEIAAKGEAVPLSAC